MFRNIMFDRTFWSVSVTLIALLGLGFIQYMLIRKNLIVSMEKLDQQVAQTLAYTGEEIFVRTPLSNLISAIIREDTVAFPVGMDSLRAAGTQFYGMYLTDRFKRAGIGAQFDFAIIDRISGKEYLSSRSFEDIYQEQGNYKIPLEGYIARNCNCAPYLNLRLKNINEYLWRDLRWNLGLALLFLLLLAIGFYLLIKLVREQRYLNNVKNEFINHLTHELKTPLFASRLSLKLLEEKSGPELHPYILTAREKNEFVTTNVEKILELASLEDPYRILNIREVLWTDILSDVLKQLDEQGKARVNTDLANSDQRLKGDPYHLKNMLLNIIDNALKYSAIDSVVKVYCTNSDGLFHVHVQDEGIGIDKSEHEIIFKKFYRVDATRVGGFGLGLSYARQVITMMRGGIRLESTPGEGTTFIIDIPVKS